jgi:hypothetical protein
VGIPAQMRTPLRSLRSPEETLRTAPMGHLYVTWDGARMKVGEPIWQELVRPRVLSDEELQVVEQLAAAVDEPLLDRQVATASVVAVCRCGCSSLRLHSDEQPLPDVRVVQLSDNARPDYFYVEGLGNAAELPSVQVVLHVAQGRIHELEVFAGEGVAVPLASLTGLTEITVA